MRKGDLKVGEEYAVFLRAGTARSFMNGRTYSYDIAVRARLVQIDAVEPYWEATSFSSGSSLKQKKGIKVEVVSSDDEELPGWARRKQRIRIYEKEIPQAKEFGLTDITTDEAGHGYATGTWNRDFVMLESAGCFAMTWAEFEAEKERERLVAEERRRKLQEKREQNAEAAPGIAAMKADVDRVLHDLLGDGSDIRIQEWTDWGIDGEQVITGADYEVPLETMARLLILAKSNHAFENEREARQAAYEVAT